jgi:hypothetical protein
MLIEHHELNQRTERENERSITRQFVAEKSTTEKPLQKSPGSKSIGKIIEFYIPGSFRKKFKWIPFDQRGKLIPFASRHVFTTLAK